MGSPFATQTINRVHVVRTSIGFDRLSREMLSKTENEELRPITVEALEQLRLAEVWELVPYNFSGHQSELREKIRSSVRARLWDICHEHNLWAPFAQAYIELCTTAVVALTMRGRVVVTLCSTYTSHEVDCAVVFDFSKKGNQK